MHTAKRGASRLRDAGGWQVQRNVVTEVLPFLQVVVTFSIKGRPGSRATAPLKSPKVLGLLGKATM